jgi:putative ABC transport system substrate-binding protein
MAIGIGRRQFITAIGGAAAVWPLAARAQQPTMPMVGILNSGSRDAYAARNAAFVQGLGEAGFIEGRNVAIEHRYADDHYDRLSALAAELVRRPVAVLFAAGGGVAPQIAKAATGTIPIVFTGGFDPVKAGLVASLNQPGGNVTGTTFLTNALEAKRLGLLHELVPQASVIGVLMNPKNASADTVRGNLDEAARGLGIALRIAQADSERGFEAAFAVFDGEGVRALLVASDSVFSGNAKSLVTLACATDCRQSISCGSFRRSAA